MNGTDYAIWNPAIDELIPHKYDMHSIDIKVENKKSLLAKMKLPFIETTPVIGMITRLTGQKGIDLVGDIMNEMMKLNVQFVILGVGEQRYHTMLTGAQKRYPDKIAVDLSFNDRLAHLIEAGSDMFLMPSRYEPCGLNQLYSLKYGTVPIVRATGGLDDSIDDADLPQGTGFKFTNYDSGELLKTIQRAVRAYADPTHWRKIVKNGMSRDFSWESPSRKYLQLYRSLARR
jgi:starch synthase